MNVSKLDWDSDFFGLRIGRADVGSEGECEALSSQRTLLARDFDLLYVFAGHGLPFSAPGAKPVDEKVVYTMSGLPCPENGGDIALWDERRGVTGDLLHLALVSGKYSRFKLDGGFPSGSYERLYSRWIEQSVNRATASEVFCYMVDGAPRGLATLNRKEGVANIGLFAVHEDFMRRGIGTALMRHTIRYAHENHSHKLTVATQRANIPACGLYEKCGLTVESITDVWHWWLKK